MYFRNLLSILCFLSIFLVVFNLKGQNTSDGPPTDSLQEHKHSLIHHFLIDTRDYVSRPLKWKSNDWLKLSGTMALCITAMPFDESITRSTRSQQLHPPNFIAEAGRVYGEWYGMGSIAAGFGIYGLLFNQPASLSIARDLIEAGCFAEVLTGGLKIALGRKRPTHSETAFTFEPFNLFNDDFHSLPSGHTTAAMAVSTVLASHSNSPWLKILAYVPLACTVYSRIQQDHHWLSDVIPAMAIGYFTSKWVVDRHKKKQGIHLTSVYPIGLSLKW